MSTLVRTVALLHTPDDGTVHVDWMWSPGPGLPAPDERVLTTLRLPAPPLECGASFIARRIHDHRARYLWWEGEIGRGLGRVRRLWSGVGYVMEQTGHRFDIQLSEADSVVRVVGQADPRHADSAEATIFRCTAHRVASQESWSIGPRMTPE